MLLILIQNRLLFKLKVIRTVERQIDQPKSVLINISAILIEKAIRFANKSRINFIISNSKLHICLLVFVLVFAGRTCLFANNSLKQSIRFTMFIYLSFICWHS